MPGIFLTADWRNLLMVNYVVDPNILAKYLPRGTELDLWQGRAYVSIVGFRFLKTKVLGVPIPFHRDFDEVNLRFYVRRLVQGEWRRGVVFIKEIVAKRAISFVARTVYNENYVRHPMRSALQIPGKVQYEWQVEGRWESVSAQVQGEPVLPAPEAEATFITEHYWGYARQRDGGTKEYAVEHPQWGIYSCSEPRLSCDISQLYGAEFAPFLQEQPSSVFMADGSAVSVRHGTRLTS